MHLIRIVAAMAILFTQAPLQADDEGEQLYRAYCVQCHGLNGNGKGINAAQMTVMPRDHSDQTEMSARTDEELFKVIEQGGPSVNKSVLMPAWGGNLNSEQINALVAHLRTLCCSK